MKPELPNYLDLVITIGPNATVETLLDFVIETLVERPGFRPESWSLISELRDPAKVRKAQRKGAPKRDAIKKLGAEAFADGFSVEGETGGVTVQNIAILPKGSREETFGLTTGWRLFDSNDTFEDADDEEAYLAAVGLQTDIVRAALDRLPVGRAQIRRDSNSFVGPVPPHAAPDALLYTPLATEITRDYADPNAYWSAWDQVEYLTGGKALVARALEVADEAEFKKRAIVDGFALGRAARPGLTRYPEPRPTKREQEMIDGLDAYLQQVGYDTGEKSLEFTAVVPEDDHLTPADIFLILAYLKHGTGGGDPVESVRVTFPNEDMAKREAQTLRDVGATAQYFGADGIWKTL